MKTRLKHSNAFCQRQALNLDHLPRSDAVLLPLPAAGLSACELALLCVVPAFSESASVYQALTEWECMHYVVMITDCCNLWPLWHVSNADWRLSLSCSWLTGCLPAPGEIHCLTIAPRAGLPALKTQYIIYFNLWSIGGNCFSEMPSVI